MSRLEDAGAPQERADGVRRQGAVVEPVVGTLRLHLEAVLCLTRMVMADDLDEAPIAGARAVGDDDAIVRLLLAADTAETNSNGHCGILIQVVLHCSGLIARPAFPVRTRLVNREVVRSRPRVLTSSRLPYLIIPGGSPHPLPPPVFVAFFIIFCISLN